MDKHFKHRVLIGIPLAVGIAVAVGVCASSVIHYPVSRYHMTKLADLHLPIESDLIWKAKLSSEWANEPWTGEDAPYQHIEHDADSALAKSVSIGNLLEQTSVLARQNPADPQAQFRWAYIARQVIQAQSRAYDWGNATQAISVVLARPASPKNYQYARLRFLVTEQNPALTELGERLLQRDPNDAPVKYNLSNDYSALFSEKSQQSHEVDPKLKQRALSLAREIIAASPTNPQYHAALAGVYASSWADRKNPEDAAKAISAYQDFLRLASPDDNNRQHRLGIVGMLQEYLSANPVPRR